MTLFSTRAAALAAALLATPLLYTACAAQSGGPAKATPAPLPPATQDARSRWGQVLQEVGTAACSQTAECRTIPIGHKGCGGPEGYLAWSTASSNEARLRQRVEAYNTARQAEVQQSGRISNCMMEVDPGARCEAGRCVTARGSGPANPVAR